MRVNKFTHYKNKAQTSLQENLFLLYGNSSRHSEIYSKRYGINLDNRELFATFRNLFSTPGIYYSHK